MYQLQPDEFPVWFRAFNRYDPFPWQTRLFLDWLCPQNPAQARWPRTVGLPTASGKTSFIDLAVLALACGSPCARRRIAFVVDRRLVVDESTRRAGRLAESLREAIRDGKHTLHPVARRLVELGGDPDCPLLVARLRGGIQFDDSWTRNPAQPAVILSTVDQIGSRLLFRSYGPSGPRSWPILAGLLGIDTLILVDEAHCARPFCETLSAIENRWQYSAEKTLQPGLIHVEISATIGESPEFELSPDEASSPPLSERLSRPKPISLSVVSPSKSAGRETLESQIVTTARLWLDAHNSGILAIVVNRVASARRIFDQLPLPEHCKLLLTGRTRPWERDALLEGWLPRLQAGRPPADAQFAVVATQCIEVGADFDFDFMISEAASLDALRQRFGRLDRFGKRLERIPQDSAQDPAGALVALQPQVAVDDEGNVKEPDRVYGLALAHTWRLLVEASGETGVVDFSHHALSRCLRDRSDLSDCLQPALSAFPLLPAYLDLLAQTSPPPEPDVEISAFLHGTVSPSADVLIVWRADLDPDDSESWVNRVAIQPPMSGEACPVPVWEARAWLASTAVDFEKAHDLEEVSADDVARDEKTDGKIALAWKGPDDSVLRHPDEIRPGDLLVVPSSYGGCDRFGWNPGSVTEVPDLGDAIAVAIGRRPVLRIAVLRQLARLGRFSQPAGNSDDSVAIDPISLIEQLTSAASDPELEQTALDQIVDEALRNLIRFAVSNGLEWVRQLSALLLEDPRRELEYDSEQNALLALVGSKAASGESETASDAGQFRRASPVLLERHSQGVQSKVEHFASTLKLEQPLRQALAAAARFHDQGKWDPRFQAWLRATALFLPAKPEDVLAKSGALTPRNYAAIRRARLIAGYPEGTRHEALSAWLASLCLQNSLSVSGLDLDLVLHLIASHHGYARPFFPVPQPSPCVPVAAEINGWKFQGSVDFTKLQTDPEVLDRFWRLVRRYGWWGLAFLEAVFRLADHRRSEEEELDVPTN